MSFFRRLVGLGSKPGSGSVAAVSAAVQGNNLPPPPPGFSWHPFKEARVAVLRPEGWYVHQVDYEHFTGCVSIECIPTEGSFKTGLTLLMFRGCKKPEFGPDVPILGIYHQRYHLALSSGDPCRQVLCFDSCVQRTVHSRLLRFRYRQALPGRPPIIVQKFLIDFDQSSDVYDFTFESPENSWDESWQKGKQILAHMVFSPNGSSDPIIFSVDPPLPPDDILHEKVLETGRAMGWSLAHEDRSEGLFMWRFQMPLPESDTTCTTGVFSWYMKRVENEIWIDDPFAFLFADQELLSRLGDAARELQEDFKRRWLALVGPVTLQGASPKTHSSKLQMQVMRDLLTPGGKRQP